jgi:hypothetical protein
VLAEANVLPESDLDYFGSDGGRLHMLFNFQVNQHLFYAFATGDTRPLIKALKLTEPRPATGQWGMFLRNHDELDLGRLSRERREAVFAAFGPDASMQLYKRGIRRRLAPMFDGDQRRLGHRLALVQFAAKVAGGPCRATRRITALSFALKKEFVRRAAVRDEANRFAAINDDAQPRQIGPGTDFVEWTPRG